MCTNGNGNGNKPRSNGRRTGSISTDVLMRHAAASSLGRMGALIANATAEQQLVDDNAVLLRNLAQRDEQIGQLNEELDIQRTDKERHLREHRGALQQIGELSDQIVQLTRQLKLERDNNSRLASENAILCRTTDGLRTYVGQLNEVINRQRAQYGVELSEAKHSLLALQEHSARQTDTIGELGRKLRDAECGKEVYSRRMNEEQTRVAELSRMVGSQQDTIAQNAHTIREQRELLRGLRAEVARLRNGVENVANIADESIFARPVRQPLRVLLEPAR
jgi:chromosome segregation ATPase